MKKTLVALSVLAASASATAGFEIYNQDGVSVNLGGDIEVVYVKSTTKDSKAEQQIQDADVALDVRYAVNDSIQVGGFWQINDVGVDNDGDNAGDAYVAVYSDSFGSIKVGRTCSALDDAGIGSDYQFGLTTFFEDSEVYCADEIVRYDVDKGNFYGTFAVVQDVNGNESLAPSSTYFDGALGYRVADFDFVGFYGQGDVLDGADKVEQTTWSVQAKYNGIENLGLAVAYYDMIGKPLVGEKSDTDTIAFAATYTIEKTTLAAGYSTSGNNDAAVADEDYWYVNAGYSVAPNTTLYAEVGGTDKKDTDTGYAVGVKAFF